MEIKIIGLVLFMALLIILFGKYLVSTNNKNVKKYLPYLICIGSGVLISLCIFEYIPRVYEHRNSYYSYLLVVCGVLFVIVAEKYIAPLIGSGHSEACSTEPSSISHQAACSSIGCILVCAFFDGVEIPASFQLGTQTGMFMSLGMLLHMIPEGAMAASLSVAGGLSKKAQNYGVYFVALAMIVGAISSIVLSKFISFETYLLPFVTGILLYVSLAHLVPSSLKLKHGVVGIFIGILFILAVKFSGFLHH